MQNERTELAEVEAAVEACNAVAVPDPVRAALVRDLGPIASRLSRYADDANKIIVSDQNSAQEATDICAIIALDIKAVKVHEVLSKITSGLHDLHRKWTGLRDLFITPMERDRKIIKGKVIVWQEAERRKAEEAQRKLQAEVDAKAALERAKQEAEAQRQRDIESAALRKAEDARRAAAEACGKEKARLEAEANAADRKAAVANVKAEAKVEAAASVFSPTVHVEAPKSGLRVSRAWTVGNVNEAEFYAALVHNPGLRGFVEINRTRLARAKAANPSMTCPGVEFKQTTR